MASVCFYPFVYFGHFYLKWPRRWIDRRMIIDKRDEISTKMKKRQFRRQDPLWGLANRFSSILKTTFHMKHPAYMTLRNFRGGPVRKLETSYLPKNT